jgi:Zn-dependent metalloprotease
MTYGDGSGTGGFDVLTALDVAGHEIGHAVCTANLTYQMNRMNEGFSDIGSLY